MGINKSIQEKRAVIEKFTLMDDIFFEAFADDKKAIQEMLRVILDDPKLVVLEVITQRKIRNLYGRSVQLDALCKLGDGTNAEIEIQNEDNDDHVKRAYFNGAQIVVKNSQTGTPFADIPKVIVIFISKFDVFGDGLLVYHPQYVIRETGKVLNLGVEYIFVNASAAGDTSKLARLMKRMQEKNVNDPEFPELTRKFNQLKHDEGGFQHMCKLMEEYTEESRAEALMQGKKQMIEDALKAGKTMQEIASFYGKTVDELKTILNA